MPTIPVASWLARAFAPRPVARGPRKPPDIQYGVDDAPPPAQTVLSALQQVGNLALTVLIPVTICQQAHIAPDVATDLIGIAFFGMALAAVLQALPRGPVGSGFLAPSGFTALFVAPSVAAMAAGGLSLMFGMGVFAGLIEAALSRVVRHLRPWLPPEIAGTATFLLGVRHRGGGVAGSARHAIRRRCAARALAGCGLHAGTDRRT